MHPRFVLFVPLLLASCTFPTRQEGTYSCSADSDCPSHLRCQRSEGLCVPPLTVGDVALASASAEYVPQPNNPHQAVTSARLDTRIRVTVTADQPVTCLRLHATPDEVGFGLDEARGSMCMFSGTPRRAGVETSVTLRLDVIDSLGVARTVEVPLAEPPRVDTLAPAAADVDTPELVSFVRAPYGALETAMLARDRVTGGAGSVEPGSRVQVVAFSGSSVLATVDASSTGAFGPAEFTADPESVGVLVIDRAGNGSGVVQVRDVTWVVNHSGPITNPHRAATRRANDDVEEAIAEEDALAPGEPTPLGRDDAQWLTVTGGTGFWQDVVHVRGGVVAFDSRRQRVSSVSTTATAVWDGTTWERVAAGLSRVTHAVYEPRGDRFVALTANFETFQRRPSEAQWTRVSGGREPRFGALLTISPADGAAYLVGGEGAAAQVPLERLDGTRWVESGPSFPAALSYGAWDPVRGTLVVFASALEPSPASFTVQFADGGVSVTSALPPPRYEPCVAWVPERQRVVLAAGTSLSGSELTDVWEWDGQTWVEVTPPQRAELGGATSCVYDAQQRGVVVVSTSGTFLLQALGAFSVRRLAGAGAPPPASNGAMGVWANDRAVVTSGGSTFEFDGVGWTQLAAPAPFFSQMAADEAGNIIGALARDGGVELSTLTPTGWQRVGPTFGTTSSFILFHQPDAGLVVESANDAWLASGAPLSRMPSAGTTLRGFERAGYSPELGSVLRISFMSTFGLGQGWANLDGNLHPLSVTSQPQVVPTATGTLLFRDGRLFRLAPGASPLWVEPNTTRGQLETVYGQPYRYVAGYHRTSRRLWVFDSAERKTSQLRLESLRPALVSRFVLPPVDRSIIQSVSLRASGFGTGGVRARVWLDGAWRDPSASAVNPATSAPQPLTLTVETPEQLQRLVNNTELLVTTIESRGDNGAGVAGAASVSVDYVQLVVHYRLPRAGQP